MKSHISLESNICPVCGVTHETGALLLDKRLKQSLDRQTITGFSLCPDCKQKHDDSYLALVAIDESKSAKPYRPDTVYRTGEICHIKYAAARQIFNDDLSKYEFIYIEPDVIVKLQEMMQ